MNDNNNSSTDRAPGLSEAVFDCFCAPLSGLGEFANLEGDGGDAAEKSLNLAWNPGHLSPEAAFHNDAVLVERGPALGWDSF